MRPCLKKKTNKQITKKAREITGEHKHRNYWWKKIKTVLFKKRERERLMAVPVARFHFCLEVVLKKET